MSIDWYRNKLGALPHQPVAPRAVPKFQIGPDGRVAVVGEPLPQETAPSPWQNAPAGAGLPSQVAAPLGQTHATEAVRYWKGTAGAQMTSGGCPSCGSPNYFPTIQAASETGGESGKLSMGHCMACGYRNSAGRSYTATPTMQPRTSLRGIHSDEIPTLEARSPHMPKFAGFQVFAKVS